MSKRKEVKYCVTAENRFTSSREIVTPPLSYGVACGTIKKYEAMNGAQPDAAYINLRVETCNPKFIAYGIHGKV